MTNKAEQMVNKFMKAVDTAMENKSDSLSFCVIIYARDTSVRTKEQPEGVSCSDTAIDGNMYDVKTVREIAESNLNKYTIIDRFNF